MLPKNSKIAVSVSLPLFRLSSFEGFRSVCAQECGEISEPSAGAEARDGAREADRQGRASGGCQATHFYNHRWRQFQATSEQ